jgi:hypothetical protein
MHTRGGTRGLPSQRTCLASFTLAPSLCRTDRKGTQLMWQRASLNPFRRGTRFHALQLAKTVYRITMWRAHNNIAFQYTTNEKKCSLLPTYRSGIAAAARVCTFYHSEFFSFLSPLCTFYCFRSLLSPVVHRRTARQVHQGKCTRAPREDNQRPKECSTAHRWLCEYK